MLEADLVVQTIVKLKLVSRLVRSEFPESPASVNTDPSNLLIGIVRAQKLRSPGAPKGETVAMEAGIAILHSVTLELL